MFVVFEGVDGSGKSTQLGLLGAQLRTIGAAVTCTREPGGSPTLGPQLRQLLLHSDDSFGARAEALLFAAERAEHVRTVIRPALEAGHVVLCDRFVDSTLAYQGQGRGLPLEDLLAISEFASDGLRPDLVVVCDLDPAEAARRQVARSGTDKIEAAGLGGSVRDLLLSRAAAEPDRYVVVDASGPQWEVQARIWLAISGRLQLKLAS